MASFTSRYTGLLLRGRCVVFLAWFVVLVLGGLYGLKFLGETKLDFEAPDGSPAKAAQYAMSHSFPNSHAAAHHHHHDATAADAADAAYAGALGVQAQAGSGKKQDLTSQFQTIVLVSSSRRPSSPPSSSSPSPSVLCNATADFDAGLKRALEIYANESKTSLAYASYYTLTALGAGAFAEQVR